MKDHDEIDFGRCLTLLHVIVEAGKHGPMFQKLVSAAQAQLRVELGEYPKPATIEPTQGGDPEPNPEVEPEEETDVERRI